jgi:hypothetical protein
MTVNRRRWAAGAIVVLAILILIAGTWVIAGLFFGGAGRYGLTPRSYETNGEQIYWTGTSPTGPPITAQMEGMHRMSTGRMACVDCHGENGEGGTVQMMMGTYEAPNIQFQTLAGEAHGDDHEEHETYTEADLKRAITEGVGPDGDPLEWVMPRWDMTGEQLDDLIAYLKTLE